MKDSKGCCSTGAQAVSSGVKLCSKCGKPGWNVPDTAVQNLIKEEHRSKLASGDNYICINPDCQVVYYNPLNGRIFEKDAVRVKVWFKDSGDDVPLCYCNEISRGKIKEAWQQGARTYADVVNITSGATVKCNCKYENPSGRCCSGVINDFLDELGTGSC